LAVPPALAAAGSDWKSIHIKGFFSPQGPLEWKHDCTEKTEVHFPPLKDMSAIGNAQLNETLSCVTFTYQGAPYYVREPTVDHDYTAKATIKACDPDIAATQQTGATEGATMGVGTNQKCPH
jgi:hypothetical protein